MAKKHESPAQILQKAIEFSKEHFIQYKDHNLALEAGTNEINSKFDKKIQESLFFDSATASQSFMEIMKEKVECLEKFSNEMIPYLEKEVEKLPKRKVKEEKPDVLLQKLKDMAEALGDPEEDYDDYDDLDSYDDEDDDMDEDDSDDDEDDDHDEEGWEEEVDEDDTDGLEKKSPSDSPKKEKVKKKIQLKTEEFKAESNDFWSDLNDDDKPKK